MTQRPTTSGSCQFADPLHDVLPHRGICLLIGAPNLGKTALLAGMARCFRDGTPVFGHTPHSIAGLGIIVADRSWVRGGQIWFARAGFPEIPVYSLVDDMDFDPRTLRRKFERTTRLAEYIDRLQLPRGSLLFVDPIALFLGGNLLDYDSVAVACHEIRQLLHSRDLTLLATAHTAKLKADAAQRYLRMEDQILGSTALAGFTDTLIYLASPEETGRLCYTLLFHAHMQPAQVFELQRDDQGLFIPYRGDAMTEPSHRVLAAFPADGTLVDVETLRASLAPISSRTLRRTLLALVQTGQIERVVRGQYRRKPAH